MTDDWMKPFSETGAKNLTSDIYSGAKRWLATLDPGGQKLSDYHAGLLNSLGFIQIMGMPKPRKLNNIYVGLRALPNLKKYLQQVSLYRWKPVEERLIVDARKFLYDRENFNVDKFISELGYDNISQIDTSRTRDGEELEDVDQDEVWLEDGSETGAPTDRSIQAIEFIRQYDKLIVLGNPGSGKTTLLKYLALVYSGHLSVEADIDPLLPIFVPLREIKRAGTPAPTAEWLRDLAVSCADDISTRSFAKEWLEDALRKGKCLILFDGVDEVPATQMDIIFQSMKSFASKYRSNKIVLTCRVAAFERSIEGFQICEIDDFSKEDVELFVEQWYGEGSSEGKRLINDIDSSDAATDLCRTPLLLTLICVLYGYRRTIPANRAELYESCVDALLFKWDTFRTVDRESLVPIPLGPERKKLLLSRVAYRAFDKNIIYFKVGELRELVQAELNYLAMNNVSAERLIKEVESHNGLFIEYANGVYCFSHLTFHEFFTALYYHDTKEYTDLFTKTIHDSRYLEVFVMCMEKMYNADRIIMQLINSVQKICLDERRVYSEYLHVLVKWSLACSAVMNRKLRAVLREIEIELEKMDIDDQSVVEQK